MLSVGIKYYMRDLLCDINNYPQSSDMLRMTRRYYMLSARLSNCCESLWMWITFLNLLLDRYYVKISLISIFSFYLILKHDFIMGL